jgi:hypothetical protein
MPDTPVIYTDDTDPSLTWEVTDANGQDVDWASPEIAIGGSAYGSASWVGTPAPTRQIRLTLPSPAGVAGTLYTAYLKVPGGSDLRLGSFYVTARS